MGCQAAPSQSAVLWMLAPPAVVKSPPATSWLLKTTRDSTSSFMPAEKPDQVVPFQRAMLLTVRPPAKSKEAAGDEDRDLGAGAVGVPGVQDPHARDPR